MKNDGTHNCLDTMGRKSGEEVGLSYCHGLGGNQVRYAPAFFFFQLPNLFIKWKIFKKIAKIRFHHLQ